jgi:LmbE family N-acetylglucosaminyl deacetylase
MKLGVIPARALLRRAVYPWVCDRLAAAGRALLLLLAEDITSETEKRSCLVLAPHPDDETFGCGATIMRKIAAGVSVNLVIATDGRHSHHSRKISAEELAGIREEEARRAFAILGLAAENAIFLRFEDGLLAEHRPVLLDRLVDILDRVQPDELFVPSATDVHPDHRALSEIGRTLAERYNRMILYEYPIWFWHPSVWRLGYFLKLRPRTVETGHFVLRKREAIEAYRSQVTNLAGEPSWATLRSSFLEQFLQREEIFFEVAASRGEA